MKGLKEQQVYWGGMLKEQQVYSGERLKEQQVQWEEG